MATQNPVKHDTENKKFYIKIDDQECLLQYIEIDEQTLDFAHTYVPPALRGQGLAGQVLKEAAEFAKKQNKKVIPSCSYAYHFFSRHSEYKDLV